MSGVDVLAAVLRWSRAAATADNVCAVDVDAAADADKAMAEAAAFDAMLKDLGTLLRRDMWLRDNPAGAKSFILAGLLVPVEVYCVTPDDDGGGCTIECVLRGGGELEKRCEVALGRSLGTRVMVDMAYALAPALAAFFHSHPSLADASLADAAEMRRLHRTGARPVVPDAVMQPAASVFRDDVCVAECVAHARMALQQCGYHLPCLHHVALADCTLEDWLHTRVSLVQDAVALEDAMLPSLQTVQSAVAALVDELAALQTGCRKLRRLLVLPAPVP
jgi:hypothetical protein